MSSPIEASHYLLHPLLFHGTSSAPLLLILLAAAALLSPGGIAWSLARRKSQIPGPRGLSAGFALAGAAAHRALATLAGAHGANRLMSFSVGFTRFVVSSHPETAREILNSPAFANRPIKESARELLFHRAMGFAPFGDYWRSLRRISSAHLFCPRRIAALGDLRRAIGERLVEEVRASMRARGEVAVRGALHSAALNNVMASVFGKSFNFGNGEGEELESMVREGYELLGALNWSDHLPLLRWMDLQGVRRRSRVLSGRVSVFVGTMVEEHRMRRRRGLRNAGAGDFVDVLLDLEEEEKLSDSDMVAVLWVSSC